MSISIQELEHLMSLARLKLSKQETLGLEKDLQNILGHLETLKQWNPAGEKGAESSRTPFQDALVLREDEQHPGMGSRGLQQSQGWQGSQLQVPKIVE